VSGTHPKFTPIADRDPDKGFWLNMREEWAKNGWKDCPKPSDWGEAQPFEGQIVWRVLCTDIDIVANVMVPLYQKLITADMLACKNCGTSKGGPNHPHKGNWMEAYNKEFKQIRFSEKYNSSIIEFKTYQQFKNNPLSHDSATLHGIHFDEECPHECYQVNRGRLASTGGPVIGSLTPAQPSEWIVNDLLEKSADHPRLHVLHMSIHDNPHLDKQATQDFLDTITDPAIRQAKEFGTPGYLQHRVFKEYGDEHYIDPPPNFFRDIREQHWPITLCIDPHDSKPTFVLWTAWDINVDDPIPYAFQERNYKGDVQSVCSGIRADNAGMNLDLQLIDRSSMRPSQLMNTDPDIDLIYEMFKKFFPDIQPVGGAGTYDYRIEEMHRLFKVNPATGVPNAFILRTCPILNWQIRHYNYKANPPSGEDRKYAMVIKKNDDYLDDFGYTVSRGASKSVPLSNKPFYAAPPLYDHRDRVM